MMFSTKVISLLIASLSITNAMGENTSSKTTTTTTGLRGGSNNDQQRMLQESCPCWSAATIEGEYRHGGNVDYDGGESYVTTRGRPQREFFELTPDYCKMGTITWVDEVDDVNPAYEETRVVSETQISDEQYGDC